MRPQNNIRTTPQDADGAAGTNPFEKWMDIFAERIVAKLAASQDRDKKRLYSTAEAAQYLGLSPAQVYRMATSGKLKCVREGRRRMVDRAELDRWIAMRAQRG
jgi:excisionase family DNA binding protein